MTVQQGEEACMREFPFGTSGSEKDESLHFVDIKQPEIVFHADEVFDAEVSGENPEEALESERKSELGDANAENEAEKIVLSVEDYNVTFDREIMEHVSFVLQCRG